MSEQVPLATLVVDFSLYPRNTVDEQHVSELVKALQSGATLPPLIVDRASKRVVDGVHRKMAQTRFMGEGASVAVEFRDYADDAALFLDAARLNAAHGRRLERQDQTRIILKLQELKVDERTIAIALHIPEPEVKTLAVRIVYDSTGAAVPQKRGLEHLRGQKLNDAQIEAMKSVRSAEVGRLCMELTRLLENELADYDDVRVEQRLRTLATAVTAALRQFRLLKKAS